MCQQQRKKKEGVQAEFDYITAWLSALPVTETNYGLIHGDFELDNLFWQDDSIAMLDFDDCSYYWHVADVAFTLRDLFETGVDLSNPSFRAFIRGYSEHYSLDEELISQLPTFMRLVKLILYAKLIKPHSNVLPVHVEARFTVCPSGYLARFTRYTSL